MCCGSHGREQGNKEESGQCTHQPWYKTVRGLATAGLLAILTYYLWAEHSAHVIAVLPFAIFLLCPLSHLFMHHDHGGPNHKGAGSGPVPADNGASLTDQKGAEL